MLARLRPQFEQAGFDAVELCRIKQQRISRRRDLVFRFPRFDYRPIQRLQRFGQQRVFSGDPVQPPRRAA